MFGVKIKKRAVADEVPHLFEIAGQLVDRFIFDSGGIFDGVEAIQADRIKITRSPSSVNWIG